MHFGMRRLREARACHAGLPTNFGNLRVSVAPLPEISRKSANLASSWVSDVRLWGGRSNQHSARCPARAKLMVVVPSNAPRIEALLLLMPLRRANTRDDSDGIVTQTRVTILTASSRTPLAHQGSAGRAYSALVEARNVHPLHLFNFQPECIH
jgi:hypothetical protein